MINAPIRWRPLLSEKAELTKKLEILADKLVEYRNDEDSIRTALLSAQRLGDTVVREANHKAGLIMDDANIKAQKIVENARRSIVKEEEELRRIEKKWPISRRGCSAFTGSIFP